MRLCRCGFVMYEQVAVRTCKSMCDDVEHKVLHVPASSICCSITIDVMYLPLPSSAEVSVCVCVLYSPIVLLDLTTSNTDLL